MRRSILGFALGAIVVLGGGGAALADASGGDPPVPVGVATADGYTPDEPTAPTLAGSTAAGVCDHDAAWISFSVLLTDPDATTDTAARLVLRNGADRVSIPLGELTEGRLAGRVLWPGASVDADGVPTGWPGWAYENGAWVQTSGNYAWTRGAITAVIEVGAALAVPLSYPAATPACTADPRPAPAALGLAVTGQDPAFVLAAAAAGGALVLGGAAALIRHRRRRA